MRRGGGHGVRHGGNGPRSAGARRRTRPRAPWNGNAPGPSHCQRGIVDRFLSEGQTHAIVPFAGSTMDSSDMPTRHSYFVALWQIHVERILADRARELGVTTVRGTEIAGFTQDDAGVDVALSDGRTLRARYLVGCDGGRSVVRKRAGIDFPGWDPTTQGYAKDRSSAGLLEADYERQLGKTIDRYLSVHEMADKGIPFPRMDPRHVILGERVEVYRNLLRRDAGASRHTWMRPTCPRRCAADDSNVRPTV